MFCRFCGNKVEDGATFCTNCGKPVHLSKEVTPSPTKKVTKATAMNIGTMMLLAALYIGISLIFIYILNMSNSILVKTIYGKDMYGHLTLKEFLDVLVKGNRIFNPTIVSTALGVGTYILIYSVPAFACIALVGNFMRKKSFSLHIVFSIMSFMSAVAVAIITPVSVRIIPEVKQAIAIKIGVIFEDIKVFSFTKLIIFAVVALLLVVASGSVKALINKRRED